MSRKKGQIISAFGKNLSEILQSKDITQSDLAKKMGMTRQQMNNYIKGINEPPLAKVIELAKILEVTLDEIMYPERKKVLLWSNQPEHASKFPPVEDIKAITPQGIVFKDEVQQRFKDLENKVVELEKEKDYWKNEAMNFSKKIMEIQERGYNDLQEKNRLELELQALRNQLAQLDNKKAS